MAADRAAAWTRTSTQDAASAYRHHPPGFTITAGEPVAYHALFWLDLYLSGSVDGFAPPAPFTLDELTPLLPERPYTKEELRAYLDHFRRKCRATIEALTEEGAARRCGFPWTEVGFTFAELLLYNMRHVQEHAAQLSLVLGERTGWEARWVDRGQDGPGGA
jgi:hypothetical protein